MNEVSMFSGLGKKELEEKHVQLTDKYGGTFKEIMMPHTLSFEKRKGAAAVCSGLSAITEPELHIIREFIKEYLYRELKELALLIYLAMEKRQDFGAMGTERIQVSFCRNILNIPSREVTQFDVDKFMHILDECDERNGNQSADQYIALLKNGSIKLFDMTIPYHSLTDVNVLLDALKADYYVYGTHKAPYGVRFILGKIEKRTIASKEIFIMKKEYIRFPQFALSIAAEVFNDTTMIRHEACEVIFYNKWQKHFSQSIAECKYALRHVNSAIREGIKDKALALSGAVNTGDILQIKNSFIEEMIEEIYYHEAGHHRSYVDMDPVHKAFINNFIEGDDIGNILGEALADWAPSDDRQNGGSFSYFLEVSRTDEKRATRGIYRLMSDNWFVDENEEFMSLMTNVLDSLTIYFINPDGSVDLKKLAAEKDRIYCYLQKAYKNLNDRLLAVIENSQYDMDGRKLNYADLEKEIYEMYQSSCNARPLEALRLFNGFWVNIVGYLRQFSKVGWEQYQNILGDEAFQVEQNILRFVTDCHEDKYNNSLREYIVSRAKETGIIGGKYGISA